MFMPGPSSTLTSSSTQVAPKASPTSCISAKSQELASPEAVEAGGGDAAMGTKVVGTLALLAQAMGPVGYHDAGYLQSFKLRQMPKIFAGQIDFFRQRHLCDQACA